TVETAVHTHGNKKPVTQYESATVALTPRMRAGIVEIPIEEYDEDSPELLERVIRAGAEDISKKLDREVAALIASSSRSVAWDSGDVYGTLIAGMRGHKRVDAFGFDSGLETDFLGALDQVGRPLFTDAPYTEGAAVTRGRLLRRNAVFSEDFANEGIVGAVGQFKENLYYVLDDNFRILVSLDGSAGGKSALDENLVFIRVEVKAGVVLVNPDKITAFTGTLDDGEAGGEGDF